MKDFIQRISQTNLFLLIITIFLVRLPPVYILPLKSPLLTSHSLARYLILTMFSLLILRLFILKEKLQLDRKLAALVLFFFATQSLSLINAANLSAFLLDYKNIVFSLALFFITIATIQAQKTQTIVAVLLIATLLNVIYEAIVYFYPETIYSFFRHIFYDKYWQFFELQFRRQRLFSDTFDEATVPFLLYFLIFQRSRRLKSFALTILGGVAFFALVSNWRIKLAMLLFATVATTLMLTKSFLSSARIAIFSTLALLLVLILTLFTQSKSNALTRLVSPTKNDLATLVGRLELWDDAATMAFYSPLTGVGLANFSAYLKPAYQLPSFGPQLPSSPAKPISYYKTIRHIDNPHNIFFSSLAETGFLGLVSLLLLIGYFIKSDLAILRAITTRQSFEGRRALLPGAAIISFWTLFLFALLNPPTQFAYLFYFWLLRGIIAKQ